MRVGRLLLTLMLVVGVVIGGLAVTPPAPALAIGVNTTSNENDADQYQSLTKSPTNDWVTAAWWADEGAKDFRVRVATSKDGGSHFEAEVTIFSGPSGQDIYGIRSAYDSNGGLHVVFGFGSGDSRNVRHWFVVPGADPSNGANWRNGGNVCADGPCLNPDLAVDRVGNVYVLYEDTNNFVGIRRRAGTGGGWGPEKRVSASDRQLGAVAVSPDGKLHVLHVEKGKQDLRYVCFSSFDAPTPSTVIVLDTEGSNDQPDLAVGPNGSVHLAWEDAGSIRHQEVAPGTCTLGERSTIGSSDGRPNVSIAVGGSGTVYVTWNGDNFKEIWEAKRVNNNWQDQERIAGPDPASRYQRYGEAINGFVGMALVQNGIARYYQREQAASDKAGPVITAIQITPPPAGSQRATLTITGNDVATSGTPVGIKRVAYSMVGSSGPFVNIDFAPVQQLTNAVYPIDLANPAGGGVWTDSTHNIVVYLVDANENASLPHHYPQFTATLPAVTTTRYLAEGYTGAGFDTYLTLANPNAFSIAISVTFQYAGTSSGPGGTLEVVGANQRRTITVNNAAGANKELSFKLESHAAFVVERPMYFGNYGSGAARAAYNRPGIATVSGVNGGHLGVAARAPATEWYFAEGFTGDGFDSYFTIQNPNAAASEISITYYLAGGGIQVKPLTVSGQQRKTVTVNRASDPGGLGPNLAFSAKVATTNGQPIIVERVMYFRYSSPNVGSVTGGTATLGATATN
ncbi:MAG: hypothetical protein IT340_02040, partial [Chloroflexi bacterium]|nr:hypothetical protein [Chloroflexota bacterium]